MTLSQDEEREDSPAAIEGRDMDHDKARNACASIGRTLWLGLACASVSAHAASVDLYEDATPANPCFHQHAAMWYLKNNSQEPMHILLNRVSTTGAKETHEVVAKDLAPLEKRALECSASAQGFTITFTVRPPSAALGAMARPAPAHHASSLIEHVTKGFGAPAAGALVASSGEIGAAPTAAPTAAAPDADTAASAHHETSAAEHEPGIPPPPPPPAPAAPPPPGGAASPGSAGPVDAALATLPVGSAVVAAPKEVLQYTPFTVTLHLSAKALEALLEDVRASSHPGTTEAGVTGVKMSNKMSAQLISGDCTVLGNDPAIWPQAVSESTETTWPWQVRCDSAGDKHFTVELNTLLDGDTSRVIDVSQVDIHVKVSELGWLARNWKYLLSTIAIPIVGWWVKRWLDKKKTA